MNKREPLMEQAYFDEQIKFLEGEAFVRLESRAQQPDTKPDHLRKVLYRLFLDDFKLLLSKYSAGYPVADLRAQFPRIIERRERHQNFMGRLGVDFNAIDDYDQSLWLVSLATLLDADDALFNRVLACTDNDGKDKLFERIVSMKVPGRPTGAKIIFPKPFQTLYEATMATDPEKPRLIQAYLRDWYPAMGKLGVYWHDNHKGPEGGGFFGYWCLEAAAVVKLFGIDDSEFRTMKYYPADLVHQS